MAEKNLFGLNASYVEILRSEWQRDPMGVPEEWRDYFDNKKGKETGGGVAIAIPEPVAASGNPPSPLLQRGKEEKIPLVGIGGKIVENMEESLELPTATSTRDIPVKVLEENRLVINDYLEEDSRPKCSFTHLIAFAIIKAAQKFPAMNGGFARDGGKPVKLVRPDINLGLAIDIAGRDGGRALVVPNIKSAQNMDFWTFFQAYNDVIERARKGQLKPEDYDGTTMTLTNPGGLGTVMSSPRLMKGQGTIFATGRIGYPAEYEASAPETLRTLGIGKVMTITSTYDHRVIQGAESGRCLAYMRELLNGEEHFYDEVFQALRIPHYPFRLKADRTIVLGSRAQLTQTEQAMRVSQLIHAYRVRGHLLAHTDPLNLAPRQHPDLELDNYGLTIWDLDREFDTLGVLQEKTAPFRDILRRLRNTYCRRMGVEYMYINDVEQKTWVQQRVEAQKQPFSLKSKVHVLNKLLQAEGLEQFLHKRFLGHKRFSIEGAEMAVSMLDELLNRSASYGVTDVVIGMAHRGRLNVLANIVGKPYAAIFAEFEDIDPKTFQGSGDVKYHLGARGVHRWKGEVSGTGQVDEREVRIELACNPSHLEAVDPVVLGQVRARQDLSGDRSRDHSVSVLLHGDAAFAGQGVVYESLQLSNLQGYRVGGTIHIVINNQIGYTTPPEKGRTSLYCTDVARAISAPVLRVNGDDPEACVRAMEIAFEYRMKFSRDVVLDLVCYRRYGHNEGDEPSFTQPILYKAIEKHPSAATIYGELLVRRGDISLAQLDSIKELHRDKMEQALSAVREKGYEAVSNDYLLYGPRENSLGEENPDTRVSVEVLKDIADKITYDPEQIEIHPRIKKQVLERRRAMVFDGKPGIDFGLAEILAYGSLLLEGIPVRLSGQDCGRGTFAHRHAVLYDINDGRPYIPLNHLQKTRDEGEEVWHPSRFRIYDSPLSEAAVVGFEYGYSVTHPKSLVIWEAQFGDFFNGAQTQIDQFMVAGEAKWGQKSRLTFFLPHGYDGQGPEHSSGRMERFLQLAAENNIRVANCSSPAQMFHLLRRQAKLPKKPLVLFTHKSILRSEEAASSLDDLATGSFRQVLPDPRVTSSKTLKRLVFCSGKVYWDLDQARKEMPKLPDVQLVRLEQLYPFPKEEVTNIIAAAKAKEVVWLQEEPKNGGAYTFVAPLFKDLGIAVRYIGRKASASPATGSHKAHDVQQHAIIQAAFELNGEQKDIET